MLIDSTESIRKFWFVIDLNNLPCISKAITSPFSGRLGLLAVEAVFPWRLRHALTYQRINT
jgi:hypothetical protein